LLPLLSLTAAWWVYNRSNTSMLLQFVAVFFQDAFALRDDERRELRFASNDFKIRFWIIIEFFLLNLALKPT